MQIVAGTYFWGPQLLDDQVYNINYVLNSVEPNLAIIVACIPTYRPLITRFRKKTAPCGELVSEGKVGQDGGNPDMGARSRPMQDFVGNRQY
jgi:hypothetical protein